MRPSGEILNHADTHLHATINEVHAHSISWTGHNKSCTKFS